MALITYHSPNIKGYRGNIIQIHLDFLKSIQAIDTACKELGFIFWVTSSFRKTDQIVKGAIVEPAKLGNHFVGCALDGNFQHIATQEWFNSKKMADNTGIDQNVIERIQSLGVRWGGDFRKRDVVHFDNSLNLRDPVRYRELLKELQG